MVSGLAFLPMVACIAAAANVSNIVLLPRIGPKPIVIAGMLLLAGAQFWLTRIGVRGDYVGDILGPLMVTGVGMGFMFSTAMNTGTYGVAPQDAGVASASVNTGQQLGGVDRHLAAQHDRGERDGQLHRRATSSAARHSAAARPRRCPGAGPGPRLHDGVLVVPAHLPRRRGRLRALLRRGPLQPPPRHGGQPPQPRPQAAGADRPSE